jgi:hypothetical protein
MIDDGGRLNQLDTHEARAPVNIDDDEALLTRTAQGRDVIGIRQQQRNAVKLLNSPDNAGAAILLLLWQ